MSEIFISLTSNTMLPVSLQVMWLQTVQTQQMYFFNFCLPIRVFDLPVNADDILGQEKKSEFFSAYLSVPMSLMKHGFVRVPLIV